MKREASFKKVNTLPDLTMPSSLRLDSVIFLALCNNLQKILCMSSSLSTMALLLWLSILGRRSLFFHIKDTCLRQMLSLLLAWVCGEFYIVYFIYFCLCLFVWYVCMCVFQFVYGQMQKCVCMGMEGLYWCWCWEVSSVVSHLIYGDNLSQLNPELNPFK